MSCARCCAVYIAVSSSSSYTHVLQLQWVGDWQRGGGGTLDTLQSTNIHPHTCTRIHAHSHTTLAHTRARVRTTLVSRWPCNPARRVCCVYMDVFFSAAARGGGRGSSVAWTPRKGQPRLWLKRVMTTKQKRIGKKKHRRTRCIRRGSESNAHV